MAGADEADMDALGEVWRRNEPSTEGLRAEVRTRGLVAVAVVGVEAMLALAAAGAGIWAISLGTAYSLVTGCFALAFAGFGVAVSWGAHRGEAWGADALTVRDQLDAAIRQTLAIRRWARAGYGVCGGAVIFLAAALAGPALRGAFPWIVAVGALAYIGAGVAASAWFSARQTRRLGRLEALQRILFDESETLPRSSRPG
jgi:hypothetical protein